MADQQFYPQSIAWGRLPNGRFFVNLDMQVNGPGGKLLRVPVTSFLFTKEEENLLLATLRGLHIANGSSPEITGAKGICGG